MFWKDLCVSVFVWVMNFVWLLFWFNSFLFCKYLLIIRIMVIILYLWWIFKFIILWMGINEKGFCFLEYICNIICNIMGIRLWGVIKWRNDFSWCNDV